MNSSQLMQPFTFCYLQNQSKIFQRSCFTVICKEELSAIYYQKTENISRILISKALSYLNDKS